MDIHKFQLLLSALRKGQSTALSDFNMGSEIEILKKQKFDSIQSYVPSHMDQGYQNIVISININEAERFRKIMMLEMIIHSWDDYFSEKYPDCIKKQYENTLHRIFNMCQKEQGWQEGTDDVYWKDLALIRQQMFPAGAEIVESYSGFGLKQGVSSNIFQTFRFLKLIASNGGRTGYYQKHVHAPELKEFNEKGMEDFYRRIAEMLKINKSVKGIFGGSWFYDPKLQEISPRLMFLQNTPLNNGAQRFYMGDDVTGNAIATSKSRLKLYNEGKYQPKAYLLIWPRKEIIKWASEVNFHS